MGFLALPNEMLLEISGLLPQSDIKSFRQVCKRFEAASWEHLRLRIECCYNGISISENKQKIHERGASSRVTTLAFFPDHLRDTKIPADEEQERTGTRLEWLTDYFQWSNIDTLVLEGRNRPTIGEWTSNCKPRRRRTTIAATHLLLAGAQIDRTIKDVRLRGVAPDLCDVFFDVQDHIYRLMKHVETFELDVLEHLDVPNLPEQDTPPHIDDYWSSAVRVWPTFLEHLAELRVLRLHVPGTDLAADPVPLSWMLGTDYYAVYFPCLTWVDLGGFKTSITELKTFLLKHRDTLKWIYLTNIRLLTQPDPEVPLGWENWIAFFILMSGRLPECRRFICEGHFSIDGRDRSHLRSCRDIFFVNRGNNTRSMNTCLVDQHVLQKCWPGKFNLLLSGLVFDAEMMIAEGRGEEVELMVDPEEPEQLRRAQE